MSVDANLFGSPQYRCTDCTVLRAEFKLPMERTFF